MNFEYFRDFHERLEKLGYIRPFLFCNKHYYFIAQRNNKISTKKYLKENLSFKCSFCACDSIGRILKIPNMSMLKEKEKR